MHLLIFSDIHQDWKALKGIIDKRADIYICLGDLTKLGEGLERAGEILSPLGERLYLLPGNNETIVQIEELCQKNGFFSFHHKAKKVGNFVFAGLGYSLSTPFDTPGEIEEEKFEELLRTFDSYQNLLHFCHNPPKDTQLDITRSDLHVGSQAIKAFIERSHPLYFFSGHIHENAGKIERIKRTTCFGVGPRGVEIWL